MQPDIPRLTAIHGRAALVGRETERNRRSRWGSRAGEGGGERGEEDLGKGERGQTLVGI